MKIVCDTEMADQIHKNEICLTALIIHGLMAC